MNTMTIADAVGNAARDLNTSSESPRLDAELLLGKVLGLSRAALMARNAEALSAERETTFRELIARRAGGAPVAYLTGTREFWSLPLRVTPAVLVPRPETETLIERALELVPADEECAVLDLGTGSGAIALAIASERPLWRVTAVDCSAPALKVARENSRALNLKQIDWRLSHWFDAVPGERFNLILANPPYVSALDPCLKNLSCEPALALTPGPSGLEALTAIAAQAAQHLYAHGWLVLEHGASQAQAVSALLTRAGFASVRSFLDFSGLPRVTLGTIHTQH
jgi:release factor glutamine methyltransferase